MTGQPQIGLFAQTACIWEATARKVGNVHRYADFADVTYLDFLLSAASIAEPMSMACHSPLGESILNTIDARSRVAHTNTNLGIVLLLAPLAAVPEGEPLREGVRRVLAKATVGDALATFAAIRIAKPGGLGTAAKEDVAGMPTLPLKQVMALAADRDSIARQYATDFADVFDFGVPTLQDAFEQFLSMEAVIINCQLRWLARTPDSLIARKCGAATAERVRAEAERVQFLGGIATVEGRAAGVAFDKYLRSDGHRLNPGTTADLVTAALFIALRESKLYPHLPFAWNVTDWL